MQTALFIAQKGLAADECQCRSGNRKENSRKGHQQLVKRIAQAVKYICARARRFTQVGSQTCRILVLFIGLLGHILSSLLTMRVVLSKASLSKAPATEEMHTAKNIAAAPIHKGDFLQKSLELQNRTLRFFYKSVQRIGL